MEDGKKCFAEGTVTIDEMRARIQYIRNKCSMSHLIVGAWLEDEEFVRQIFAATIADKVVDERMIYEVAKAILEEHSRNPEKYPHFRFKNARNGVNRMKKSLGDS